MKATAIFILLLLTACTPAGEPVVPARATASPTPLPTAEPATVAPAVTATTVAPSPVGATPEVGDPVAAYQRTPVDVGDPIARPSDLHGDELVFVGQQGHIILYDVESEEAVQLTDAPAARWDAVLNEQYVAWIEQVGETTATIDGREERVILAHVVVYERADGTQQTITESPAPRMGLALDGERLVWMDRRNELEEHYSFYDLYAYDLAGQVEQPIAVAPGAQEQPDIAGDLIVWRDNRDNPERDGRWGGCGNCPENQADIYLYDFASGDARPIVEDDWNNAMPAVGGGRVAWVQFASTEGDLYLLAMATGERRRVTETAVGEGNPQLFGNNRLGWTAGTACDVIEIDESGQEVQRAYGAYVLDLETGEEQRLTDFKEPRALFHDDRAAITEGCMTGFETYVVNLESAP